MADNEQTPAVWAVVELMGHVKMAGRLTEEEKFGGKMGRLDIPLDSIKDDLSGQAFATQFFTAASVYRLTVVSEAVARQVARGNKTEPVSPWDYPKQLAAGDVPEGDQFRDDEDDDDSDLRPEF